MKRVALMIPFLLLACSRERTLPHGGASRLVALVTFVSSS
jgi:hypothetical protein